MTVQKFKNRGWRMDFSVRGHRVQKACKGARNKTEALAMEQAERKRLEGGARPGAKAPLFEEFAPEFLDKYARANNKPSEYDTKEQILRQHLSPYFQGERLDAIEDEDVEAYKAAKLQAKLEPKTINNHLAVFSKLMNVARDWKRIATVPRVKRLKVAEPEFDFLTFEEARRLADHAGGYPFGDMIRLGLNTGLRQGELLGLRVADVLPDRIMVRQSIVRGVRGTPKSHKPREVPLNRSAKQSLLTGCVSVEQSSTVFSEFNLDRTLRPLTKGESKRPLWNACKRAGLRRIGWHVLRHTFASHLAMKAVPILTIRDLLGHADIKQTLRYAHLAPSMHVEAVKLLDVPTGDLNGTKTVRT